MWGSSQNIIKLPCVFCHVLCKQWALEGDLAPAQCTEGGKNRRWGGHIICTNGKILCSIRLIGQKKDLSLSKVWCNSLSVRHRGYLRCISVNFVILIFYHHHSKIRVIRILGTGWVICIFCKENMPCRKISVWSVADAFWDRKTTSLKLGKYTAAVVVEISNNTMTENSILSYIDHVYTNVENIQNILTLFWPSIQIL